MIIPSKISLTLRCVLRRSSILGVVIPGILFAVIALADEGGNGGSQDDRGGESGEYFQLENCINRSAIRRTEVIDDYTIVFYMSHQKIYLNRLPNRCSGLRSARTFSYRPTGSQLCNVDTIKVVRNMGGRPNAGPSCGLGKFRPVTGEEVAMIKSGETEIPPEESRRDDDSGDNGREEVGEAD